jgi:hypothetical protein
MKQETLEEALYKYVKDSSHELYELRKQCFLDGYKLAQERSYSEEEVKFQTNKLLNDLLYKQGFSTNVIGGIVNEWFEQFKKK